MRLENRRQPLFVLSKGILFVIENVIDFVIKIIFSEEKKLSFNVAMNIVNENTKYQRFDY